MKQRIEQRLSSVREQLQQLHAHAVETDYAFIDIPEIHAFLQETKTLVQHKQTTINPDLLVVIGIGGSSTGARAIIDAMLFYTVQKKTCIFLETVDVQELTALYGNLEQLLQQNKKIMLAVMSKSGTTTETLVNASILIELLKKYHPHDYNEYIVVVTDKDSVLWNLAQKEQYACLVIPHKLGGRFSVFSPVGLLPLVWCDIDCNELLSGAATATRDALHVTGNEALACASTFYEYYQRGMTIHDIFVFSPALLQLAAWYRQLIGESLGKREDVGITPTISLGSQDLHSVAQLYLAGPRTTITTFMQLSVATEIRVPCNEFSSLGTVGAGKTIAQIQNAFVSGIATAYEKEKRPALHIQLSTGSAYDLGYFMQQKMFETVYLAELFEVNPFNQPEVELYKKETRALLS